MNKTAWRRWRRGGGEITEGQLPHALVFAHKDLMR